MDQKNIAPGIEGAMNESKGYQHQPVLLDEIIDLLQIGPNRNYVDGTLGLGGHAEAILNRTGPEGRLMGIDRDTEAISMAEQRLSQFSSRMVLRHGVFAQVNDFVSELDWPPIDGMLLDLGVSSMQLDKADRGFSFSKSSALDMRMDLEEEVTARELLNSLPEKGLEAIFREYGEERFSRRIARQIVRRRQKDPLETTDDLRSLISRAVPFFKNRKIHPATRVFQALRIAVNRELEILENFLKQPPDFLKVGGVLVVISYHSLEDRIVKWAFRSLDRYKPIFKKPLQPTSKEIRNNSRARSAKLRAIQRVE